MLDCATGDIHFLELEVAICRFDSLYILAPAGNHFFKIEGNCVCHVTESLGFIIFIQSSSIMKI